LCFNLDIVATGSSDYHTGAYHYHAALGSLKGCEAAIMGYGINDDSNADEDLNVTRTRYENGEKRREIS
jgi:hypothetical protein